MSDTEVRVRRAGSGDADEVTRLWHELQIAQGRLHAAFAPGEDALQRWANDYHAWVRAADVHLVLVVEVEGRIVGFATAERWYPPPVYRPATEVFLTALYVEPDARRRGLGRALVEAVRGWAVERGADRIRLRVVEGNEEADAFWRALRADTLSRTLELRVAP